MKLQEFATERHEHADPGLRDLAAKILWTAIVDARSTTQSARYSARTFLFADDCEPLLRLWCDCAGINVDAFRAEVRKLVAQDERRDSVTSVASPSVPSPAGPSVLSQRLGRLFIGRMALRAVQRRLESSTTESQHVQP